MATEPIAILFVCLGNICRSPMAEGIFRSLTSKSSNSSLITLIDSCGTAAYHTGSEPDPRTMSVLQEHGIEDYDHSARKITNKDFDTFDYIFAMDRSNLRDLERLQQRLGGKAKVKLFGSYSGKALAEEVGDPYYGAKNGFEIAYEQCVRFSSNFLEETFPSVKD